MEIVKEENVVSYVGSKAIIVNNKKEILIVKENWSGAWGLPGGRIQDSEIELDVRECLKREMQEELGENFKVEIGEYFDSMFRVLGRPRNPNVTRAFAIFFICKYLGGEINLQEKELSEYAWVGKEDYESYEYVSGYKNILDKFFSVYEN